MASPRKVAGGLFCGQVKFASVLDLSFIWKMRNMNCIIWLFEKNNYFFNIKFTFNNLFLCPTHHSKSNYFFLFSCTSAFSQIINCGIVDDPNSNNTGEAENIVNCFDLLTYLDIFDDCTPVYLNVNLHLFVDNDWKTRIFNSNQFDAYVTAENFINQANSAFEHNQAQSYLNTPEACIPIRYGQAQISAISA
jgi:hypothetical protein